MYGNMPLGAETLAALTMALWPGKLGWWWGALAGKLVMAGFALLGAVLLAAAGRRFASPQAGIVAALIYLSTPWIVLVSVNGLNEGVIAYYLLAAAYATKLWLDAQRTDPAVARGYLWLAGWMAGSAVACKYTSVVFVVLPLLVLIAVASRRERAGYRAVLAFTLAVTCACGLWLAKSWVQTGNPVYPLLAHVLDGRTRTPEKDAQFRQAHRVPVDTEGRRYSPQQAWQVAATVVGRQPLAQSAGASLRGSRCIAAADAARGHVLASRAVVCRGRLVAVHASPRTFPGPRVAFAGTGRRHRRHLVRRACVARHDVDRGGAGPGRQLHGGRFPTPGKQ